MPDLCQLGDVKAWLGIAPAQNAEDTILSRLISAVSSDFLNYIQRPDLTPSATYTDVRSGNGKDYMFLRHWPINSIQSVTIDGVAIPASPDGIQPGYWLDTNTDPENTIKVQLIGYLFNGSTGQAGLGIQGSTANPFTSAPPNVVIVYSAGYPIATSVVDEVYNIPATPGPYVLTVLLAGTFTADVGVKYSGSGAPLTKVVGVPTVGQYAANTAGGVYTFAAADQGVAVKISYSTTGLPTEITQAVIDWVALRYKARQWIGQSSKHMNAGETVSFQSSTMPDSTRAVADQYKQTAFLISHD